MRLRRIIPPLTAVLIHNPVAAQEPVEPYDATGRYRTTALEVQITGAFGEGRDLLLAWGGMQVGGSRGQWMQRAELAAGVQAGRGLVDRLMAGPQFGTGFAMPGAFVTLQRGTRGEPYLLAGGGAYGVADVAAEELGISPNIYAGVGLRVFDDPWDVALTQVEVLVQQRFGTGAEGPQLYVRFGRAVPPGRPGRLRPPVPGPGGGSTPRPPRG